MRDLIDRQAAIETVRKAKDKSEAHRMLVQLPSAQPECEDAVSRAAVINVWRDACNSVMSKCACHYDDDIKDTVYDNTSEVNAVLRCNKEFKNALKVLPLITPKQPGWIPWDSGKFPEESGTYTVTAYDGAKRRVTYAKYQKRLKQWELTGARAYWRVLAWMPHIEPWEGGQDG